MMIKVEPSDVLISEAEKECINGFDILCDIVSVARQAKDSRKVLTGSLADKVSRVDLATQVQADHISDEGGEGEDDHEGIVDNAELAGPSDEGLGLLGVGGSPLAEDVGEEDVPGDVDGAADVGDDLLTEGEVPRVLKVLDKLYGLFKHF